MIVDKWDRIAERLKMVEMLAVAQRI